MKFCEVNRCDPYKGRRFSDMVWYIAGSEEDIS